MNSDDYKKIKLSTDWRLTIFGKSVPTPKDLLPNNHPESPHYERQKRDHKK